MTAEAYPVVVVVVEGGVVQEVFANGPRFPSVVVIDYDFLEDDPDYGGPVGFDAAPMTDLSTESQKIVEQALARQNE